MSYTFGKRSNVVAASRRDLSTRYCPVAYWLPPLLFSLAGLAASAIYLIISFLYTDRFWLLRLTSSTGPEAQISLLRTCARLTTEDDFSCSGLRFALDIKGLNIPEDARNELAGFVQERLTYAFAIFPISGILVVVTLVIYGAGYMLRSACYCLFGRGNRPAFFAFTAAQLASTSAAGVSTYFLVNAQRSSNSEQSKFNVLPLALLCAGVILLITASGLTIYWYLQQKRLDEDDADWLQNEESKSSVGRWAEDAQTADPLVGRAPATPALPINDLTQKQLYSYPTPLTPRRTLPEQPSTSSSIPTFVVAPPTPRLSSPYQTPASRPTVLVQPPARIPSPYQSSPHQSSTPRAMYEAKSPRDNFTKPPVYAASSRYSQSTFFPNSSATRQASDTLVAPPLPTAARSSIYSQPSEARI